MNKFLVTLIFGILFIVAINSVSAGTITNNGTMLTIQGGLVNGTLTSANATSLTDTTQAWTANYTNRMVRVKNASGFSQYRRIGNNNATTLFIDVPFTTTPSATNNYTISYNWFDVNLTAGSNVSLRGNRTILVTDDVNLSNQAFIHGYEND